MLIGVENIDGDGTPEGTADATDDLGAQNYTNMEIGLRRGQEGELQHARVKRRRLDEEGNPVGVANSNQLLDTRQYEVEYDDGSTEVLSANVLAENLLAQVDEHGHRHRFMEELVDHRSSDKAVKREDGVYTLESGMKRKKRTTAGWDFYVTWKDGSSNWIPLKDMKESFPIEVADYAISKGIQDKPAFAWWVPHVTKKRDRFLGKVKSKYWERTHKKYGIRVPRTIQEALDIDEANGDNLWKDSIELEMKNNRIAFEEFEGGISRLVCRLQEDHWPHGV
mmetsp:Transcript_6492/g.15328  ORF Transcript_6492/g.15328 Transcript_6492/m.15328 type:complete len:280 (+) Transcript_6492:692-1531(+)